MSRRRGTAGGVVAVLISLLLVASPTAGTGATARAEETAALAAYDGPCVGGDATSGVTVVVDFQGLNPEDTTGSTTLVRCSPATLDASGDPAPRTGLEALRDADIETTGVARWGDAFVCRLEGRPAADEPIAINGSPGYRERCIDTPPASAYWSYWHADGTGQDWQYSQYGVMNRNVVPGGFEGWSFSLNATAETNPKPRRVPVNDAVDPEAPRASVTLEDPLTQPVPVGAPVTVAWTTDNVTSLVAEGDWNGDLSVPSGSRTFTPDGAGTYELGVRGTGPRGETSDTLTLTVGEGEDPDPEEPEEPEEPAPGGGGSTPGIDPAARAVSGWLIGELDGSAMPAPMPTPGQPHDWGLTIDTLWALYATGTGERAARAITTAVDRNAGDYMGIELFRDARVRRAGQTAKLLVAAVVAGRDPDAFGRRMTARGTLRPGRYDMRQETLDLIADAGPQRGRIRDRGLGIDNTNVFSQSLAVIGLARSGGVPRRAVDYLLRQQCAAGYFRMFDRNDRTCDQDDDASDGDGTAMGVQALMTARAAGTTGLGDDIARGVRWLLRAQRANGSFGGGVTTEGSNTNSTGLIAQTLAAADRDAAFREAKAYVKGLTVVGSRVRAGLAGERGAIAYNRSALDGGLATGISGRDQWRRATAQAVFALAPVSFVDLGKRKPRGNPPVNRPPAVDGLPSTGPGAAPVPPGTDEDRLRTVDGDGPVERTSGPDGRLGQYLAGRLVDGDHVEVRAEGTTYVDYELTADVVLALRLMREQPDAAARATRFLLDRRSVAAYAHGRAYENGDASYAEPLGKLVMVSLTSPRAPHARVARDLGDDLADLGNAEGWRDTGTYADSSGSASRTAWAALAATASGHGDATLDAALAALVAGQCRDGSFPATTGEPCEHGDVASTALAAEALAAAPAPADAGPVDARSNVPPVTWGADRAVAVRDAGEALQSVVGLTGHLVAPASTADQQRIDALAGAASGRASLGLDTAATRRVLVGQQRADGGLPSRLASDPKGAPPTRSDLAASAGAAGPVAGRTWLTAPGSPLSAAVQLPLALDDTPTTPVPGDAGDDAPGKGPPWPWIAAALALAALAYSLGRLRRSPSTRPERTAP